MPCGGNHHDFSGDPFVSVPAAAGKAPRMGGVRGLIFRAKEGYTVCTDVGKKHGGAAPPKSRAVNGSQKPWTVPETNIFIH